MDEEKGGMFDDIVVDEYVFQRQINFSPSSKKQYPSMKFQKILINWMFSLA